MFFNGMGIGNLPRTIFREGCFFSTPFWMLFLFHLCSQMVGSYCSKEERAWILIWKQEIVGTCKFYRHTWHLEHTTRWMLASTLDLLVNVIPPSKPIPGCPTKTFICTDNLLSQRSIGATLHFRWRTQEKSSKSSWKCLSQNHSTSPTKGPSHYLPQASCQTPACEGNEKHITGDGHGSEWNHESKR